MRIAITGGTGFVGGHLARELVQEGHEVVLIARPHGRRAAPSRRASDADVVPIGLDDEARIVEVLAGCDGVAHCAGINREIGSQTYNPHFSPVQ